jgi:hypothetical protein
MRRAIGRPPRFADVACPDGHGKTGSRRCGNSVILINYQREAQKARSLSVINADPVRGISRALWPAGQGPLGHQRSFYRSISSFLTAGDGTTNARAQATG